MAEACDEEPSVHVCLTQEATNRNANNVSDGVPAVL